MKIKKIALMLVMALSINIIGAPFVFAASSNNANAVKATVSQSESIASVENGAIVQPNSVGSVAVKAAANWIKSHASTVIKLLPVYVSTDWLFSMVDAYVNYSDTVHSFLTNVISSVLPSWAQWTVPGIVASIEFLLPI
ncbi:MAG TPA: hypothetical protein VFC84_01950 [Desulfosporosinus sp.]|nr:hypothetical protein [Desulfosporosinus sp.]